ncbi:S9 family peptidase [bacterium]|nr:S9 family peptidase [bacterium]
MERKKIIILLCVLGMLWIIPFQGEAADKKNSTEPRPLENIQDILDWKSIRTPVLSNDGRWFAYQLSPNEGNSTFVIRETKGDKEYRFPMGKAPSSSNISFSHDSQWVAYPIYPTKEEAEKLKKQKKKPYNKAGLVNLSSGEKKEFEKVKQFSFSGENPSWIAFHKYPPESQKKEKEKWEGSDLLLYELSPSQQYNFGNVSEFAFDKKGRWLAWIIDAQDKTGNGVQFRNMKTGVITPLDTDEAVYKSLNWTEEGEGLAVLKGKEDENYENKLYSVIGFTDLKSSPPQKVIYNPQEDSHFPKGMTISPHRKPFWTKDLSGLLFGIHELEKKEEKKEKEAPAKEEKEEEKKTPEEELDKEDLPDLVIWHWKDNRLQSMQQVQEKRDEKFNYLSTYRVDEKKFIRLADDKVRRVIPAPEHRWGIGIDREKYELMGNLNGRRYQDIYVVDLKTGERRLALEKNRWFYGASPEGTHFLYYKDGHFYTYEMASGKSFNITKDVPTSFIDKEDDHNVKKPPIRPVGWVKDGVSVLLYDNWDVWNIPVHGGKGTNLTVDGKEKNIRYRRRFRLDPEEKGIDLSGSVYFSTYGEWTKKAGIARIDKGKPGAKRLLWDDAAYSRLIKAKDEDVFLYTKETHKDYPDYYVSGPSLKKGEKITEANPQQENFLWSDGTRLLDYTSDQGDKLQGALFLPSNYEEGKSYPTVVYIYEELSQRLHHYSMPRAYGFNKSVYTSRGYAVLMPDITYKINNPGMSAVWCVLPAIKAAIDTGIVDKNNIGLHGHSWGGYQTTFLITQTDLFEAAVAGAPLTNMISMYSSIYWNTGSANQPIFESSQGRFKGGYWDNLQAYQRNSPVYHAEKVSTPLLLLHNDKDGAVDWNQGIEYFNTLRRLKKPVVMLQYKGENHGLRKPANQKDYFVRMQEFFDHYLRGKPVPKWWEKGIPHLKLKEHLKEKTKEIIN